jgi:hypothetical protein
MHPAAGADSPEPAAPADREVPEEKAAAATVRVAAVMGGPPDQGARKAISAQPAAMDKPENNIPNSSIKIQRRKQFEGQQRNRSLVLNLTATHN